VDRHTQGRVMASIAKFDVLMRFVLSRHVKRLNNINADNASVPAWFQLAGLSDSVESLAYA